MMMTPIKGPDIEKYISKCSVCETPTKVMAMHSQTINVPDCPQNWEFLWAGYSFIMVHTLKHFNQKQFSLETVMSVSLYFLSITLF